MKNENSTPFNIDYRNDLFHLLSKEIAVPLFTDFFKELMKQETELTDENIQFLFEAIGYLRNQIAVETLDAEAHLMGVIYTEYRGIVDLVSDSNR